MYGNGGTELLVRQNVVQCMRVGGFKENYVIE